MRIKQITSLLSGRTILVSGLRSERSIAYGIITALLEHGATVIASHQSDERAPEAQGIANELGIKLFACDVVNPASITSFIEEISSAVPEGLDGFIHSMAFAPSSVFRAEQSHEIIDPKDYLKMFQVTDISYHDIAMRLKLHKLLKENSSLIAISYIAANQYVEHYGILSGAKAALEAHSRDLSVRLGKALSVRSNIISAGPMHTDAAEGIPGFEMLATAAEKFAPLGRLATPYEVGKTAVSLIALMTATTGSVITVDCGEGMVHYHSAIMENDVDLTAAAA